MDAAARMTGSDGGCNDIVGVADVDTVVHHCSNSLLDDDEKEYDKSLHIHRHTHSFYPAYQSSGTRATRSDQSINRSHQHLKRKPEEGGHTTNPST
jgi:hypothetical protein